MKMNTCHRLIAFVAMGIISAQSIAGEQSQEIVVIARWLSPTREMDWASGSGVEAQVRFWQTERTGIALTAGGETWTAVSDVYEEASDSSYLYSATSGDTSVALLGISVLHRSLLMEGLSILMDLGVRYAFIESALQSEVFYEDASGSVALVDTIEIDDTVLGVAGVSLDAHLNDTVSIQAGVSYQVDLSKPAETFAGEFIGDTSFQAVSFNLGIACVF